MLALAFGLLIVFVVVAGAIWIVTDLNDNMLMPSSDAMNMRMQR
jgi:cytochrome o ubiquinol oxidase operon protein cyoD